MSPNQVEMFPPDPDDNSGQQSGYQQFVIESRDRVSADSRLHAESANYGDVLWRWEFPVCSVDGQVMRYVRVNAATEEEAVVVATLRIDADRSLGKAVRIRRAAET